MNRQLSNVYPESPMFGIGVGAHLIIKQPRAEYIVARIPGAPYNKLFLVNLNNGGYWAKPVEVVSENHLTREEVMDLIAHSPLSDWEVKGE